MRLLLLALLLHINGADDPFGVPAKVRVLIFARTDCPITNRYAPELARIGHEFESQGVRFWIVYPDKSETIARIHEHMADYNLPGEGIEDPGAQLRKRAEASVSPQAAVFDSAGKLIYSGRIDDRFVAFGKARPEPTVHDLENAIRSTLNGQPVNLSHTKAIGCYLDDLN